MSVISEINKFFMNFIKTQESIEDAVQNWNEQENQDMLKKVFNQDDKKIPVKRGKSAYIFFCQKNRDLVKEENPELSSSEITSKLAEMWKELKADEDRSDELEEYNKMASENKESVSSDEKKTKSPVKRAKSAYIFFCQKNRPLAKEENPELSSSEITSKLAEMWKELKADEDRTDELEEYNKMASESKESVSSDENDKDVKKNKEKVVKKSEEKKEKVQKKVVKKNK